MPAILRARQRSGEGGFRIAIPQSGTQRRRVSAVSLGARIPESTMVR